MKKVILALLFVLVCFAASAQTYRLRASEYCQGTRNSYDKSIRWGSWQSCKVLIVMDFDDDYIKVYSQREQNYVIISSSEMWTDSTGGRNIDCTAVDEEGIECTIRLRVQKNGIIQFYAFYSNVAWIYSGLGEM